MIIDVWSPLGDIGHAVSLLQAGKSDVNDDPATLTHLDFRMLPHPGTFAPATSKYLYKETTNLD